MCNISQALWPELREELAEKRREIAEKDREIAEIDRKIAEKDREIAEIDRKIAKCENFLREEGYICTKNGWKKLTWRGGLFLFP